MGVRWLFARPDHLAHNTKTTATHALAEIHLALAGKLHRSRRLRGGRPDAMQSLL